MVNDTTNCRRCGNTHQIGHCPAFGKICNRCSKKNHFAKQCQTKVDSSIPASHTNAVQEIDTDTVYCGSINVLTVDQAAELTVKQAADSWWQNFTINGRTVNCKLDTGAQGNVMSSAVFDTLPQRLALQPTTAKLIAYGGVRIT